MPGRLYQKQFAMRIDIHKSINEIQEQEWNEIVPRNRIISIHSFLRVMEESGINKCEYFYIVIRDNDKIMAHASLYSIGIELDLFARGILRRLIDLIRRSWGSFLILSSVECGSPVALGSTICFRDDIKDRAFAVAAICREAERLAAERKIGIMLFRDYHDDELDTYAPLAGMGYSMLNNLPYARLTIRWKTFDEYLSSMRSDYRHKYRDRTKLFRTAGGEIEFVSDFAPYADKLADLWKNIYDNATEYRREVLKADYFRNMAERMQQQAGILMARIDGQPVGFVLLLFGEETLIWQVGGLDYRYNKDYAVYFNMLYEVVRLGIERRFADVDCGITTLPPKQDIGCDMVPLRIYMKHMNPFLRRIAPWMFSQMTPATLPQGRRVFK